MNIDELEAKRQQARQMCDQRSIAILPYGNAYWIKGDGVDLVINDIAWLREKDVSRFAHVER